MKYVQARMALVLAVLGSVGPGCDDENGKTTTNGGRTTTEYWWGTVTYGSSTTAACQVAPETAAPPPEITGLSLSVGPAAACGLILIHGRGFQIGATVLLDDVPATVVEVDGPETIYVGGTPGAGRHVVVVTNPDGRSATYFAGGRDESAGGPDAR